MNVWNAGTAIAGDTVHLDVSLATALAADSAARRACSPAAYDASANFRRLRAGDAATFGTPWATTRDLIGLSSALALSIGGGR